MIPVEEALRIMHDERGNSPTVLSYTGSRLWRYISTRPELDLPCGSSMGKVSNVALGIALAQPEKKVLAIDGDGALLMNLGGLVTVAEKEPKNFCYVLLQDGVYLTTGEQPVPGVGKVDFAAIARGAGFTNCYTFDDVEEFAVQFRDILRQPGPTFVALKVENPPGGRNYRPADLPEPAAARRFGEAARDMAKALS